MCEYTTYIEIPVTVYFDYQPEEETVMYPNDQAYPGCPASVTINAVEFEGIDIFPQMVEWDFLADRAIEEIKKAVDQNG